MPPQVAKVPILGIIPARGGSRGVIRKNLRGVGGRHLLARTVELVESADVCDQFVISSDDDEILAWADSRGLHTHRRGTELAGPDVTIAETAAGVVRDLSWEGLVVVFQPTVPLRTIETIQNCLARLVESGGRSIATVSRERHLMWRSSDGDLANATPLFTSRVNRQFQHDHVVRETGSVQAIYSEDLLKCGDMVSDDHLLFETDATESDDIDDVADLRRVVERVYRGHIVLRLTANRTVGSGHLHHCLQIAEHLDHHQLTFLLRECDDFAVEIIERAGWTYQREENLARDLQDIADSGPRILVNDILDTSVADVAVPLELKWRVVNIEDRGPGARLADLVINALYAPEPDSGNHVLNGPRFATLRTEFMGCAPKVINPRVRRVLITFGGTDPNDLARHTFSALHGRIDAELRVIQGPAARPFEVPDGSVVLTDIPSMAAEMMDADLVITAAGRTVYEAAATGTPVLVLSQHPRESSHAHLSLEDGVIHLGLGTLVSGEELVNKVHGVCNDVELRREMSGRLRRSIDHLGAERIAYRMEGLIRGYD